MQDVKVTGESNGAAAAPGDVHVQGGITRTLLQKVDFPDGRVINASIIEVPAGNSASPHTHPGVEIGYVIGGEFYLCIDGKPDQHQKLGSSYAIQGDDVHYARVPGPEPLKILCVFVVDKNKPLATVERPAP